MKIDVSEYYKEQGYTSGWVNVNKEPRRVTCLYRNGEIRTMSYAKYLYTSYYKCDVDKEYHVDHINGDKMDDRIENLQVISSAYNIRKDHKHRELVELTCPVCNNKFLFEKRNLSSHPNPCCSRRCGGIKSHWKK